MQLVPLDLVRDEGGHEVVDVGRGGDEDGEGVATVVPAAAAGRRFDGLPAEDVCAEHRSKALRALTHEHTPAANDRARKASYRVEEGAHVDLGLGREGVENRSH